MKKKHRRVAKPGPRLQTSTQRGHACRLSLCESEIVFEITFGIAGAKLCKMPVKNF